MGDRTWPHLLTTLLAGQDLSAVDTAWAMGEIIAGNATAVQITAFTIALRAKGETPGEVDGLVEAVLDGAVRVPVDPRAVDVVGTGGDQAHTVNISTMASIVVAGAGIPVVKHGGRSVSSSCGSADVLAKLGIPLDLSADAVARCVEQVGIGYCFAPTFHAGLRHAAPARREMGVPTVFNYIAPLVNPAQPRAAAVGCANERMASVLAQVLAARDCSALVVRGEDGLDEVTTTAPTRMWVVRGRTVREAVVDTADLGVPRSVPGDLRGGTATYNAEVARSVLTGQTGPVRDAVLVNAAAAIAAYRWLDEDVNLDSALAAALDTAQDSLDSGAAAHTLDRWIQLAGTLQPGAAT